MVLGEPVCGMKASNSSTEPRGLIDDNDNDDVSTVRRERTEKDRVCVYVRITRGIVLALLSLTLAP
eukprot:COSAG06_NODE_21018_length_773_cov_0.704748_1_plen_66_part_00